ncbi:hypothetical protein AB205_0215290 [Aquarana catesbeiana]|uniref:Uncharacterized protein n=1 Tax=Aquarana catesbeiana TaxID=8400 RepID=A0A2G9QD70_AQUCT|nr:hypothetical protein AB205_0215290 [Aquarana catesbeiana]
MWMLWKKKPISQVQVHRSSSGRSWCAIGIYRRSRKTSMMWKKDSKTSLMFKGESKTHQHF